MLYSIILSDWHSRLSEEGTVNKIVLCPHFQIVSGASASVTLQINQRTLCHCCSSTVQNSAASQHTSLKSERQWRKSCRLVLGHVSLACVCFQSCWYQFILCCCNGVREELSHFVGTVDVFSRQMRRVTETFKSCICCFRKTKTDFRQALLFILSQKSKPMLCFRKP